MNRERDSLLVTSDHGNLEEADHKRHTLNPVPFLVWGAQKDALFGLVHSLEDVTPALLALP
jgi:bisphosphoglycerate-independent phosphoglycerate mutase (AlkP superfamily)